MERKWQTLPKSFSQYHHGLTDQSRLTDQLYNIIDWQILFTWPWRWLPLRLSKRQSPTTVLFRTTLTQTITQYELLILLGSNHLLKWNKVKLNEENINHMLYLQFERDELIKYEIFPKIHINRSVRRYWESLWDNCSKALEVSTIWFILFLFLFYFFVMGKKFREIRVIRHFRYHWESPWDNCSRALEVSTKDIPDNDGRNGLYGF